MKTTEGCQKKKYSGETPKTVRFTMDQPFGQSMFMDMTKGFDKGATFTLPVSFNLCVLLNYTNK